MQFKDYYQTLGVARDASADDFEESVPQLARKYHPDVSKEADAELHMKEVNEAYAVLSDPEKRAAYDQLGRGYQPGQDFRPPPDWDAGFEFSGQDFSPHEAAGFSDFFAELFGRMAARAPVRSVPTPASGRRAKITTPRCCSIWRTPSAAPPADQPARAAERRPGPGSANDPHPQREDSQGRSRRPGDPAGGSGCARDGRLTRGDLLLEVQFKLHPRFQATAATCTCACRWHRGRPRWAPSLRWTCRTAASRCAFRGRPERAAATRARPRPARPASRRPCCSICRWYCRRPTS